jgi:hypothetical protein
MSTSRIPLMPQAQTLSISLGGNDYRMRFLWNTMAGVWMMDISAMDGTPILSSIPLISEMDLIEQYGYLEFGGGFVARTLGKYGVPATYSNLGGEGNLYFTVP